MILKGRATRLKYPRWGKAHWASSPGEGSPHSFILPLLPLYSKNWVLLYTPKGDTVFLDGTTMKSQ